MNNYMKNEFEATLKSGFETLPQDGTGLILFAGGSKEKPTLIWGRATKNAKGYGMDCYKVLKLVRDADGDVSILYNDESKNRKKGNGGFADEIIAEIEKFQGVIRVHSFVPTETVQQAKDLKNEMYRLGVFSAFRTKQVLDATEQDSEREYLYEVA